MRVTLENVMRSACSKRKIISAICAANTPHQKLELGGQGHILPDLLDTHTQRVAEPTAKITPESTRVLKDTHQIASAMK